MIKRTLSALLLSAFVVSANAQVGPKPIVLGGTTQYDGWQMLNATNYPNSAGNPQYGGGFPGTLPWTKRIDSDLAGSGDASFGKDSGTAYITGSAVYNGGFQSDTNVQGATFSVKDPTAVAGLKTVVFQLETAASFGNLTFYNNVLPTLTINGGTESFLPKFNTLFASTPSGTSPLGNPATADLRAYQYDLSAASVPVTSYQIQWTNVQHALIYSIRLDASSQAYPQAVPEPGTMVALGFGALALIRRKRK